METAILIIYVIFIFIFGLNSFFLVKLTIKLSNLINNQDTIIKDQKTHLDFFNSLMDGLKKMFLEREDQIVKKFEAEKAEMRKELKVEMGEVRVRKADLKKAIGDFAYQFAELLGLTAQMIYLTGNPPIVENLINRMEGGFAKEYALKSYEKVKQELEKSKLPFLTQGFLTTWFTLLKNSDAFLPDKNKSSSQK